MRFRKSKKLCLAIAAASLLTLPTSRAQQLAIATYYTPSAFPYGITNGPESDLWVSLPTNIARVSTAGTITEYATPDNNNTGFITVGPDGALWFSGTYSNNIGRMTTAGAFTLFPVPTPDSLPTGIASGSDGNIWFTENYGNKIGRMTTTGVVTEYPLSITNSSPNVIAPGPDGALWFTQSAGYIGRITTSGAVTEYAVPTPDSGPFGITSGPDGALWFTESAGKIGRITTSGSITEFPLPSGSGSPTGITPGPDGTLWFAQRGQIGSITTAGAITEYAIPGGTLAISIVTGPDGNMWFTQDTANAIGEGVFVTAGLTVTPDTGSYQTDLTFTGSAFAPNEKVQIYREGVGSHVLASATTDSSGSFTVTARNPEEAYGPRIFLGAGQTSGKLGAASFSMTPRLVVTPDSGPLGSAISVSGYGFGTLDQVEINWYTLDQFLGFTQTNQYGSFNGSAALSTTVPSNADSGLNVLLGIGYFIHVDATVRFTVE